MQEYYNYTALVTCYLALLVIHLFVYLFDLSSCKNKHQGIQNCIANNRVPQPIHMQYMLWAKIFQTKIFQVKIFWVKDIFGQRYFWSKIFWVKDILGQRYFGSKIFQVKDILGQDILGQDIFGIRCFCQDILGQDIFYKMFWRCTVKIAAVAVVLTNFHSYT